MSIETRIAAGRALDPKNFPPWAKACPQSFRLMQEAIAKAGVLMAQMSLLSKHDRENLSHIMGHVAATCWAAGAASVKEAAGQGAPTIDG